jgi:cytochrome c-type biogenesis protein CcmH
MALRISVLHVRGVARFCLTAAMVLAVFLPAGAQQTDRAKAIGHRMFCMCGCKQILVECNHVGCTMSTSMLKKLDAQIASGANDDLVVQSFVQEFGAEVVAEPPAKGFNWLAWIMPFAAVGAGLLVIRMFLTRWYHPVPALPGGALPPTAMLDRIRREAEHDE